jgi:hypothetical protein
MNNFFSSILKRLELLINAWFHISEFLSGSGKNIWSTKNPILIRFSIYKAVYKLVDLNKTIVHYLMLQSGVRNCIPLLNTPFPLTLQVKSIKFKHAVNDILVNRICVAVTFAERVAVFDAARLEESFSALGARWLAYADRQLSPSVRSSGGVELEGVPSYTATVLQAAKTLGKGIR